MKNTINKGQTLLEITAVLVIIGVILAAVIPAVSASTDNGRIQSALSSVKAIESAATGFYNDNQGSYASITMAGLSPKYLNAAAATDPWGGTITVGPGTVTNQYVVSITNVPSSAWVSGGPFQTGLQNNSISSGLTNGTLKITLS